MLDAHARSATFMEAPAFTPPKDGGELDACVVPGYRVIRSLGTGGMGVVFLAE
ncbi:MAG: hypothetical protein ACKVW3_15370 [Phycisphaerales bacterium]